MAGPLDEQQAKAVLNEAQSRLGIVEPSGVDVVTAASALLEEMQAELQESVPRFSPKDLRAILEFAETFDKGSPGQGKPVQGMSSEAPAAPASSLPTPEREEAEALVASHRLAVPGMPEGDPPEMPRDLTDVGDREARKLHSEFNAYLAWVTWLIGVERSDKDSAERLADFHQAKALAATPAMENGEKVPQHVRLAKAQQDPEAVEWRKRAVQHGANLHLLFSLKDVYAGNVERLSRDWRMRVDEFTMSGGAR